jgi:hypothetical protein
MGQDRVSDLGILSIEKELALEIKLDEITDSFASLKNRKGVFFKFFLIINV